jgi:hypothetical protein
MTIISDHITIYHLSDGSSETLRGDLARNRVHFQPDEWSMVKPPPLGWERTVPRYVITRDLRPSPNGRHKNEAPFSEIWQSDIWQQADRNYEAGEVVETTSWPHPSMRPAGPTDDPAHYAAEKILEYFKVSMKSRLQVSPWHQGQVRLSDGISGSMPQHVSTPQIKPQNMRPVA